MTILQYLQIGVGLLLCLAAALALVAYAWKTFKWELEKTEVKAYVAFLRMIEIPEGRLDIDEFCQFLLGRFDPAIDPLQRPNESIQDFWARLDDEIPRDRLAERLHHEKEQRAELNAVNLSLRDLIGKVVDEMSQMPAGDHRFQSIYGRLSGAIK